jgi:hypothetical protein
MSKRKLTGSQEKLRQLFPDSLFMAPPLKLIRPGLLAQPQADNSRRETLGDFSGVTPARRRGNVVRNPGGVVRHFASTSTIPIGSIENH